MNIEPYTTIGGRRLIRNSDFDARRLPCAVILDTNVVKDIGAFYFGNRKIQPGLKQLLQYIRSRMRAMRKSFGTLGFYYRLGLAELSVKRNQGINYSLFRNYGSAICSLATCSDAEFERICDMVPDNARPYGKEADPSVAHCIAFDTNSLPLFYGNVLHLLSLQIGENQHMDLEKGLELFERHYKWQREELGFVQGFSTMLALYQLLGKDGSTKETRYRGNARHLTKFDPNNIRSPRDLAKLAWNAAWDMLFLMRLSDYRTGEVFRWQGETASFIPAVLISKDYDPSWLSLTVHPIGDLLVADGSTSLPLFESTSDFFDPYHSMGKAERTAVFKRLDGIKRTYPRKSSSIEKSEHVIPAIHELEASLGIEKTSFPGYDGNVSKAL